MKQVQRPFTIGKSLLLALSLSIVLLGPAIPAAMTSKAHPSHTQIACKRPFCFTGPTGV